MKILLKLTALALLVTILLPSVSHAMPHGGVYAAKYIDGSNVVIISNNAPDMQSGILITYNLRIYDREGQPISFTNAHTEIKSGSNVIDTQQLRVSQDNDTNLLYTYKSQGAYVIFVKFTDHDKLVAKGEFPIVVNKNANQGFFADLFTVYTGVTFLLGVGVAQLYRVRKQVPLPGSVAVKKALRRKK